MAISLRQARRDVDLEDVTALWGEYLRWANDQFDAEYGGIGKLLLDRLVGAAREIGCDHVLLDSTRFMHAAHALYRSVGFYEIEPYPESEIPTELRHHWLFMRLSLD